MKEQLLRIFLSNPVLKVFSISLAVALFFLVREDRVKELKVEVPLVMTGIGVNQILTAEFPATVTVRMRGRSTAILRAIETRPSPYEVNLQGRSDGDSITFELAKLEQLVNVSGLSATSVEPATMEVRMEPRLNKRVPVVLSTSGSPAPDHVVNPKDIDFHPREVELSGSQSELATIESIQTHPISLEGLSKDLRAEIQLRKPSRPHVALLTDRILVEIQVTELQGEETIEDVVVGIHDCADTMDCSVRPKTVSVRMKGSLRQIHELQAAGNVEFVWVDAEIPGDVPGVHRQHRLRTLNLPGVKLQPSPRSVTLRVRPFQTELIESPEGGTGGNP